MTLPTRWTVMSAKSTDFSPNFSAHLGPSSSVNIRKCPLPAKNRIPPSVSICARGE